MTDDPAPPGRALQAMVAGLLGAGPGGAMPTGRDGRDARGRRDGRACGAEVAWLQPLPAAVRQEVLGAMGARDLQPGEVLLERGDALPGWYGVRHGLLEIDNAGDPMGALGPQGLPPGGWFGEQALLAGQRSEARLVARGPTRVLCLPEPPFAALLAQPAFCRFLLRVQARRLVALRQRLAWPRRPSTTTRVALQLADLFAVEPFFGGDCRVALSQAALAAFLGLSRQRTNAALRQLQALGEVALAYRSLRVMHPAGLAQRALAGDLDAAPRHGWRGPVFPRSRPPGAC